MDRAETGELAHGSDVVSGDGKVRLPTVVPLEYRWMLALFAPNIIPANLRKLYWRIFLNKILLLIWREHIRQQALALTR